MNCRKTFNCITLNTWRTIAVTFFICSIVPQMAEAQTLFEPAVNYGAGDWPQSINPIH